MQRNYRAITLIAVALISGCGQVCGTAQPATELFDPCAVVPDEAIRAAGADPATKDSQSGPDTEHWAYCTWSSDTFFLGVQSTTRSMSEFATNPNYIDPVDVEIPSRPNATRYRLGDVEAARNCLVAFPWSRGAATILVDGKLAIDSPIDPCALAISATTAIAPFLPM